MSSKFSEIAQAVVQHLAAAYGVRVEITPEIRADLPEGATADVQRTVTENCRTLRFDPFGFEQE